MIKCPNCGTMNEAGSRFCFQCGQPLASDAGPGNSERTQPVSPPPFPPPPSYPGSSSPASGYPPPPPGSYAQDPYGAGGYPPGTPPGYMMPPEPPRRRRWLWIILGIILGCILVCAAFAIWGATAGDGRIERWATELSEYSTEQADN